MELATSGVCDPHISKHLQLSRLHNPVKIAQGLQVKAQLALVGIPAAKDLVFGRED